MICATNRSCCWRTSHRREFPQRKARKYRSATRLPFLLRADRPLRHGRRKAEGREPDHRRRIRSRAHARCPSGWALTLFSIIRRSTSSRKSGASQAARELTWPSRRWARRRHLKVRCACFVPGGTLSSLGVYSGKLVRAGRALCRRPRRSENHHHALSRRKRAHAALDGAGAAWKTGFGSASDAHLFARPNYRGLQTLRRAAGRCDQSRHQTLTKRFWS